MFSFQTLTSIFAVLNHCNLTINENPSLIGPSTRQNMSSGFLTKRDSNQSPELHRLGRKLKFRL